MLFVPYNSNRKYKLIVSKEGLYCHFGPSAQQNKHGWYARLYGNGCRVMDAFGLNQQQAIQNLKKKLQGK
jgi:hypothetical protein